MGKTLLRRAWDTLFDILSQEDETAENIIGGTLLEKFLSMRAISMSRLREMLWDALDESEESDGAWAYPIDIFVNDTGDSLSAIVTQSGKLYEVPLNISEETVTLGAWVQVKQEFTPTTQTRFTIKRQKDGSHRWLFVAGTSVLNRVGEIDSSELFDSFIKRAEDSGKYPRVDFYHLGSTSPETWEFGTADYLARDGVCYIASGTFDEDHPLARATIKAYEEDPDVWGCSIEFYAMAEPELVAAEPEIYVPMYKDGINTRISVVKEEDAAGLFTRMGIKQEKIRMKRDILDKLGELFGDDEEALKNFMEQFEEGVDGINRTVKDEKLIHRSKKNAKNDEDAEEEADEDDASGVDVEDPQDEDEDEDEDEDDEIVLDDGAIQQVAEQVSKSPAFATLLEEIKGMKTQVTQVAESIGVKDQEIGRLVKQNKQLTQRLDKLEKTDKSKKKEWLEDLPARRQVTATYRPSQDSDDQDDDYEDEDGDEEDMAVLAERTLATLPRY